MWRIRDMTEGPGGANKARDLIRTVRMKGDESSWRMINWIKSRDPKLAERLGLNLIEPMDMR
uniref:CARD domain-containing protein n=1 Tax=Hippocampus comes TaxID=109280 RepID=A0A3Q2YLL6_HIPCM